MARPSGREIGWLNISPTVWDTYIKKWQMIMSFNYSCRNKNVQKIGTWLHTRIIFSSLFFSLNDETIWQQERLIHPRALTCKGRYPIWLGDRKALHVKSTSNQWSYVLDKQLSCVPENQEKEICSSFEKNDDCLKRRLVELEISVTISKYQREGNESNETPLNLKSALLLEAYKASRRSKPQKRLTNITKETY